MAVTYDTATKQTRIDATRASMINGSIEICTAAYASVLATFTLTATAGTCASGVWTIAVTSSNVSAAATGTAAIARIKDSGGTARITGLTVGTSGTDVIVANTSINSGQTVTFSSGTITHA